MAVSTCAHCQNQSFEIQEVQINGASQRLLFVQCTDCGAPVDVVDNNALQHRHEQDLRIKNLEQQLAAIASGVSHIGRIVAALANQRTV
jgi:hypothetical protein